MLIRRPLLGDESSVVILQGATALCALGGGPRLALGSKTPTVIGRDPVTSRILCRRHSYQNIIDPLLYASIFSGIVTGLSHFGLLTSCFKGTAAVCVIRAGLHVPLKKDDTTVIGCRPMKRQIFCRSRLSTDVKRRDIALTVVPYQSMTVSQDTEPLIDPPTVLSSPSGHAKLPPLMTSTIMTESAHQDSFRRWLSLVLLVIQNAMQALLIRYSKTRPNRVPFLMTSIVFFSESLKLIICICLVCAERHSLWKGLHEVYDGTVKNLLDTAIVAGLSCLYTLQNILIIASASNLNPAVFQVSYQIKIFTTAMFFVIILKRPISRQQWFALLMLFVGISVVQVNETLRGAATKSAGAIRSTDNYLLGIMSVLGATVLSGFSGVYLEKMLKTSSLSLWMRNIQLSVTALPISLVTMLIEDYERVRNNVLQGYDALVWTIVLFFAVGGLLVAATIKYADNIQKGFATSISIIITSVASVFLFDFQVTSLFCVGTLFVLSAVYIFAKFPPRV